MPKIHLTDSEQIKLIAEMKSCKDIRVYKRVLAVLEAAKGRSVSEIAEILGVERKSVYNWIDLYLASRSIASLEDQRRSGRPSVWSRHLKNILEVALQRRPDEYGFCSTEWTAELLKEHIHAETGVLVSKNTIRNRVHQLGYT